MFSHIVVGVHDFECAYAFYGAVLRRLGLEERFCDRSRPWAGWHNAGGGRPLFVIAKPYDGQPHDAGNGQMAAFLASCREDVRDAYRIALAHGGTCEGAPGLRPHYHPDYYGAYVRDPDGNKIAVVCHEQEDDGS